jgi:DNA-binding CsgD family transcriptional regulator
VNGAMIARAMVALDLGDFDVAERLSIRVLEGARRTGNVHVGTLVLGTLSGIALARGDLAAAREHLGTSVALHQKLGDVGGVAEILERFVGLAAAQGRHEGVVQLAAASSALHLRAGSPLTSRATARLEQSLEPARRALGGEELDTAWSAGSAMDVKQAVTAALAITELAEIRAACPPGPSDTSGGAASPLTRREQEVAGLIAHGLTNRQIAERLVITEGTAANHVVHILGKLGYHSRAQVAVWAAEHGLSPEHA